MNETKIEEQKLNDATKPALHKALVMCCQLDALNYFFEIVVQIFGGMKTTL